VWSRIVIMLSVALVVIVLAALAWTFRHDLQAGSVELKRWIGEQGIWAPVMLVAAFVVLTPFMVPDTLLTVSAGVLFGFVVGAAVVLVGTTIARATQYLLARQVLKQRVQQYVATRPGLAGIERAVRGDQFRLQVLIRLTPMSPTLVSYIFGSADVRFGGFMLALAATVPMYLVQVYLGVEGVHVIEMASRPEGKIGLQDVAKIGGLLFSGVSVFVVTRTAVRAVRQAAETNQG